MLICCIRVSFLKAHNELAEQSCRLGILSTLLDSLAKLNGWLFQAVLFCLTVVQRSSYFFWLFKSILARPSIVNSKLQPQSDLLHNPIEHCQ